MSLLFDDLRDDWHVRRHKQLFNLFLWSSISMLADKTLLSSLKQYKPFYNCSLIHHAPVYFSEKNTSNTSCIEPSNISVVIILILITWVASALGISGKYIWWFSECQLHVIWQSVVNIESFKLTSYTYWDINDWVRQLNITLLWPEFWLSYSL